MGRQAALLIPLMVLFGCSDDIVDGTGPEDFGSVRVVVNTTGVTNASSYLVTVDGGDDRSVATNGSVIFTAQTPGDRSVSLSSVPSNCTVTGANPRSVAVVAGETIQVVFSVNCTTTDKPDEPDDPEPELPIQYGGP